MIIANLISSAIQSQLNATDSINRLRQIYIYINIIIYQIEFYNHRRRNQLSKHNKNEASICGK